MKKYLTTELNKNEPAGQSKIIRYVGDLSPKEREHFYQFVNSPYFNQHEKTRELLDLILANLDHPNGMPERDQLFKRLFPREPFDEQKLHNVMSYLKKLYHRFLAQQFYEKQAFQEQLFTLESAYEKSKFPLFNNRIKALEKSIEQHPHRDSNFHLTSYRLNTLLGFYQVDFGDRSKPKALQKVIDHLDRYYLIEKLRTSCQLTANMMLANTQYDFGFFEELLQYLRSHFDQYSDDPSILMHYTILMSLVDEGNPQHYEALKEMLSSKMHLFGSDERRDLYSAATNYCIRQSNLGQSEYRRELFELYQKGLTTGLLLTNGALISEFDYKNVAMLGCSLKEFNWTEQFIQEYRESLPAHRRENIYNFNLANLYYNKKMYNEALTALMKVQFTDVRHRLNTNMLILRTYFALRDTEALLSLIETFRIYIIRNRKLTTVEKKGYTNFLRFSKNLVLLRHHASTFSRKSLQEKLETLRQKIDATPNVINKHWLLEECEIQN
jgi:hypothetical protein